MSNFQLAHQNIPVENMSEFVRRVADSRSLAGLDVGSKTIGVGVSDTSRIVSTPYTTIARKKFSSDVQQLLAFEREWYIGGYIIGLPKNMDGSSGPKVQSIRAFAYNLCRHTELPVTFWDERLSTVAAERYLLESNTSRRKRAQKIDSIAASVILQNALDYLNNVRASK